MIVYYVTNISRHSITLVSPSGEDLKVSPLESVVIRDVSLYPSLLNLLDPSLGLLTIRKDVLIDVK